MVESHGSPIMESQIFALKLTKYFILFRFRFYISSFLITDHKLMIYEGV